MSDDNKLTTAAAVGFTELKGQLSRIEDMMVVIKERNEEMADDISKIKEAIYNPDMGIYSRLKELESWIYGNSSMETFAKFVEILDSRFYICYTLTKDCP